MHVRIRLAALVGAAALAGALSACASTTNGFGSGTAPPSTSRSGAPATASSAAPGTGTTGAASSGPSSTKSASASSSPPPKPIRTVSVTPADGGAPLQLAIWGDNTVADCAAHAYGAPVLAYLHSHQCRDIRRVLASTTYNGRALGIAAETVGFGGTSVSQSYAAAGNFAKLVTKDGTGMVNDLVREGVRIPGGPKQLPYPDTFFAGAQDDGAFIYEAFYLQGKTPENDPKLEKLLQGIVLQF